MGERMKESLIEQRPEERGKTLEEATGMAAKLGLTPTGCRGEGAASRGCWTHLGSSEQTQQSQTAAEGDRTRTGRPPTAPREVEARKAASP